MIGMYAVYFLYVDFGVPLFLAFAGGVLLVALFGLILHHLVIRPILGSEPINQLLVTGGVLFFLQAFATLLFGVEFRNLGLSLPSFTLGGIFLPTYASMPPAPRSSPCSRSGCSSRRAIWHRDPRGQPGSRDHAADGGRHGRIYLITSASAAGSPGLAPASWSCSTTSIRRSGCRRADHLHGLRHGWPR